MNNDSSAAAAVIVIVPSFDIFFCAGVGWSLEPSVKMVSDSKWFSTKLFAAQQELFILSVNGHLRYFRVQREKRELYICSLTSVTRNLFSDLTKYLLAAVVTFHQVTRGLGCSFSLEKEL